MMKRGLFSVRWPLVVLALFVLCTRFSRGQIESSGSSVIRSIDDESLFPEESFDEDRFLLPFVEEKVDYALGLVELAPRLKLIRCLTSDSCPSSYPFCENVKPEQLLDPTVWFSGLRACFQCTSSDDSLCGTITPTCKDGICTECSSDSQCARFPANPLCDPQSGNCVQCVLETADNAWNFFEAGACTAQVPTCGPGTAMIDFLNQGNCVQCVSAAGPGTTGATPEFPENNCPSKNPLCTDILDGGYVVSPVCRQCSPEYASLCSSKSTKACSATTLTCIGCQTDEECGDSQICVDGGCTTCTAQRTERCEGDTSKCLVPDPTNSASSLCVQCLDSADCQGSGDQAYCDPGTNTCRECLEDANCDSGVCVDGSCVPCRDSSSCGFHAPHCEESTHQCVPCLDNELNACDPGQICVDKSCVPGCLVNSDCPTGQLCSENKCRQCTSDNLSNCEAGQVCNAAGVCTTCTDSSTCAAVVNTVTPVCKTETTTDLGVIGECVACVGNVDCQGTSTPICCGNVCKACCQAGDCPTEGNTQCEVATGSCVPCLTDPDCTASGSSQNPFCVDKTCVGCRTSADCVGGVDCIDGQCQITGCTSSSQCTDPQLTTCDLSLGQCVQCTTSNDCSNPATPVCGKKGTASFDQCIGCRNNDDCVGIPTGPFCDTQSGMCKGCLGDENCGDPNNPVCCEGSVCCPCEAGKTGACDAYGYKCDVTEKTCKQCLGDLDCPSGHCLAGVCVDCTQEADCPSGTYCDDSTNSCIDGCNEDIDCSGNHPYCRQADHQCVQCTNNDPLPDQCSDTPGTVCELVDAARINECVECSPSIPTSCPGDRVCNPESGTCVPCLQNSDCAGNAGGSFCYVDPSSPANNMCVPCLEAGGGCPTGQVCKVDGINGNTCVPCLDSDGCPNGVCDTTSNICVPCLPDGTGCQDPTPICKLTPGPVKCVACTDNVHCGGSTPYCDTTTNTCTTCLVSDPGSTCPANNPVCIELTNGGTTCVQCDENDDELCGANQRCLTSQHRCVSCIENQDCAANGINNRCSPQNKCVPECSNDNECSGQTPICEGGKCVENKVTQQSVITGYLSGRFTCPMISGLWSAATGQRAGTCGVNGSGCCHCPSCGNGCPFRKCGRGSGCGNANNFGCLG